MAVPVPLTATAGDKLSAAIFNSQVRDALTWAMGNTAPKCHVSVATTGISIPGTGVLTLIPFNNEIYDLPGGMHDNATNPSRLIATETGYYEIDIQINSSAGGIAASSVQVQYNLNSGGVSGSGTVLRTMQFSDGVRWNGIAAFRWAQLMTAGTYIEAFTGSSTAFTTSTATLGTRAFMRYIST